MHDQEVILYKKEDTGNLRMWKIVREGNKVKTFTGIEGGSIVESQWTVYHGKNIGRINATSDNEQAELELNAKVLKKREDGYSETGDAPTVVQGREWTKPTLALKWKEAKHRINYPCYTSPKLDGIRCICNKDGMWSRNGKPIYGAPHIRKQLQPLFDNYPDLVLDGELYAHDLKEDFNRICSIIKKKKPTPADLAESESVMEYWVFDMKDSHFENKPFSQRYQQYRILTMVYCHNDGMAPDWKSKFKSVRAVQQFICTSEKEVERSCERFIKQGFEGGMIRNADAPYEQKRTHNLQKYKTFCDDDYIVLDVEEGAGNRSGMMGRIKLKTVTGQIFNASAEGDHAFYTRLLQEKDQVIGKMATVRYQNLTPDGVPRFGIVTSIRDYE
jgi:DNA ligase-1